MQVVCNAADFDIYSYCPTLQSCSKEMTENMIHLHLRKSLDEKCVTPKIIEAVKTGTKCYIDISNNTICKYTLDKIMKEMPSIINSENAGCEKNTSDSE